MVEEGFIQKNTEAVYWSTVDMKFDRWAIHGWDQSMMKLED